MIELIILHHTYQQLVDKLARIPTAERLHAMSKLPMASALQRSLRADARRRAEELERESRERRKRPCC